MQQSRLPLIAPKHVSDYSPEEYHTYVTGMFALMTRGRKPAPPAPGLSVKRKDGVFSVRRSKLRAFNYVTYPEIAKLAKSLDCAQADLWNVFKSKNYIITATRMDAERAYATLKGIK